MIHFLRFDLEPARLSPAALAHAAATGVTVWSDEVLPAESL
jgi:hypothetical protein